MQVNVSLDGKLWLWLIFRNIFITNSTLIINSEKLSCLTFSMHDVSYITSYKLNELKHWTRTSV